MSTNSPFGRARLRGSDRLRTGMGGLIGRPARTLLTALGVAIGIASMYAVVGISASSRADLLAQLDELGTNLLQVRAGQAMFGDAAQLPTDAETMLGNVATVTGSAGVTSIDTEVTRSEHDDLANGLSVVGVDGSLASTLQFRAQRGRLIDDRTQQLPVAVLGSVAAQRLDIHDLSGGPTVYIAGRRFQVIGVAEEHPLHADLNRSVFVGHGYAVDELGVDANHTAVYVLVRPDRIDETRAVLARTANPANPSEVQVSRPSDALEAQAKVDENLQQLLLALGAVALLVGGIGIANIMVISVLERRPEIGLRRALGATTGHIRSQFVIEAASLSLLGGAFGLAIGAGATWVYANSRGWTVALPVGALTAGVGVSLAIGAVAGLYPAAKAARLDPAQAIRPL